MLRLRVSGTHFWRVVLFKEKRGKQNSVQQKKKEKETLQMNKLTPDLAQSWTRVNNGAVCRGIIKAGFSCTVYINNKSDSSLDQHLIWSVCFSVK